MAQAFLSKIMNAPSYTPYFLIHAEPAHFGSAALRPSAFVVRNLPGEFCCIGNAVSYAIKKEPLHIQRSFTQTPESFRPVVHLRGVEPPHTDPDSDALSTELQVRMEYHTTFCQIMQAFFYISCCFFPTGLIEWDGTDRKDGIMTEQKKNEPKGFWKLYGKYIAIIAAALILIIVIIIIASSVRKRPAEPETGNVITMAPSTTAAENAADSLMSLKLDAYPEVNALVKKYFDAKKNCDADQLNKIVDYQTDKTKEELELENQFVEGYQDIKCYTASGMENGSYVVYVYYKIKFTSIPTTAPSLIRLYVCTNTDQSLYIYGKNPSGELKSFIDEMDTSEDVRILIATVNKELKEACAQDEALAKLQEMLKEGTNPSATAESFEPSSGESQTAGTVSSSSKASESSGAESSSAGTTASASSSAAESPAATKAQ